MAFRERLWSLITACFVVSVLGSTAAAAIDREPDLEVRMHQAKFGDWHLICTHDSQESSLPGSCAIERRVLTIRLFSLGADTTGLPEQVIYFRFVDPYLRRLLRVDGVTMLYCPDGPCEPTGGFRIGAKAVPDQRVIAMLLAGDSAAITYSDEISGEERVELVNLVNFRSAYALAQEFLRD